MSEEKVEDEAARDAAAEPEDDLTAPPVVGTDRAVSEATSVSLRARHGFTVKEALAQRDLLLSVAAESPIRQTRYEMRRRGREWDRAGRGLAELDGEGYTIELVGQVEPGMQVVGADEPYDVVRRMTRDGQTTLHVEDQMDGRAIYLNFYGTQSPVVVKQ